MATTDGQIRAEDENTLQDNGCPSCHAHFRATRPNESQPGNARYHLRSGNVSDDEIKIGTFLLRLPESQLKTHLLMRVDTLKNGTGFRSEVDAISRAISTAQTQPTPMDVGAMSKGTPSKGGKGAKVGDKRNNQMQQACPRCGNTDHTSANCPHFDKTCRKCGKSRSSGECVSIFWNTAAQGKGRR